MPRASARLKFFKDMRYICFASGADMSKTLQFPTKVLISLSDERISAIDAWRRQQGGLPDRSEAIRRPLKVAFKIASAGATRRMSLGVKTGSGSGAIT
jgi:threonine aldolase